MSRRVLLAAAALGFALTSGAFPVYAETAPVPADAAGFGAGWASIAALDPVLGGLLAQADTINDVAETRARLREAEALARASRASLLPSVSVSGQALLAGELTGVDPGWTTGSVSASQDLDLFGANRARARAEGVRADAAADDVFATRLQARRQIALTYVALRTAQTRRTAAARSLAAAEDNLALAQARQAAGLETGLGVSQAETARDNARAALPPLDQAETAQRLALEAILGQPTRALVDVLAAPAAPPRLEARTLMARPSDVLATRPDLRAAANRARAAGLDAQGDRRDRWPRLSLDAVLATTNEQRASDATGNVTAGLLAPVFQFGRLQQIARAGEARAEAAAIGYRQTVLEALAAIETQASRLRHAEASVAAQEAALTSARDQAALARARYTSGLASFLDVTIAESAVAAAEDSVAAARGEAADAAFTLLAELGTG